MADQIIGMAQRVTVGLVRRKGRKTLGAWRWQGRRIAVERIPGAAELEPGLYLDYQTGAVYRRAVA